MTETPETPESDSPERPRLPARAATVAVAAVVIIAVVLLARSAPVGEWLAAWHGWADDNLVIAMLAFTGVFVVATVVFAPGAPLTIAAGALFGIGLGTVAVSIGSTLGAALAFLVARYLARDHVSHWLTDRPRARAIDAAIRKGGWKVVALMRLSPVVPFNLQNYVYGLTSIGFWSYLLTSWLAMLPGTLMYVYIGYVGAGLASGQMMTSTGPSGLDATTVATTVGLVATAAVTIYIAVLARRELATLDPATD